MNIEYKKIINELFGRQRAGIKPGLERTLFLLEALANPHLDLQCIHIAGTNGKGTCSSLLASYYMELGRKVGLYTSPHLVEFNERIRINGVKIPSKYLVDIYLELKDKIDEIDATFFEITTVIAFKYFAVNNCDICIIETGMGGRFDCTNVINPLISIITSISIDHKEFLGDSLEQIAFEKAGIIKENTPVILGNINRKLEYIFEDIAKNKNAEILKLNELNNKLNKINEKDFNSYFEINNNEIKCELFGKHNEINLNLIANVLIYLNEFKEDLFINSIIKLNINTGYFGRLSILKRNPYLILDTGHNKEALTYLVETIKLNTKNNFNIVYTGMFDKNNNENLAILKILTDKLYLTKSSNPRNAKINDLENIAKELGYNNIISIENLEECIVSVLKENSNTLIVGSFFLIGDVIKILKSKNYGAIGLGFLETL